MSSTQKKEKKIFKNKIYPKKKNSEVSHVRKMSAYR